MGKGVKVKRGHVRWARKKFARMIEGVARAVDPMSKKSGRMEASAGKSYRGADHNRLFEDWIADSLSADADLLLELDDLRARSRDLYRNNSFARAIISSIVNNVVGRGMTPQSRVDGEELEWDDEEVRVFQKKAERVWKRAAPHMDAQGINHVNEIERLVMKKILEDGDIFVHLPRIKRDLGRPYSISVELIEAHRVQTPPHPSLAKKKIRDGIELDRFDRPVAAWVLVSDPSDFVFGERKSLTQRYRRIPFKDADGRPLLMHLYQQLRPGQSRGEPLLAPTLSAFKHMGDWQEAELVAKKVESCFAVFRTRPDTESTEFDETGEVDAQGQRLDAVEPAMIEDLEPGEKVEFANPSRPGSNFAPYVKVLMRGISAAASYPYEVLFGDYAGMNYSSARTAILDARRVFRIWQEFICSKLLQPLWDLLLEEAWLRDEVPVIDFYEKADLVTSCSWVTDGWQWVDPLKEVDAELRGIEGGVQTRQSVCAARGEDWEEVARQLAREEKFLKELDVETNTPEAPPPPPPGFEHEEEDEDRDDPKPDELEEAA